MHKNNALMSPNLVDEPKLNCEKKKNHESDVASIQLYKNKKAL